MRLSHVTWKGPAIDDEQTLGALPANLAALLKQVNGFIQFHGGLHVRGACTEPAWHSLRNAWYGERAFYRFYKSIKATDVPFAEDFIGDQYLLRNGNVILLHAETDEVEDLELKLDGFFDEVGEDPEKFLGLELLLQFQENGGKLEPGQLLAVMPPLCSEQASGELAVSEVGAEERHEFLAKLAAFVRDLPPGSKFDFQVSD
jgi:hypothetical protein